MGNSSSDPLTRAQIDESKMLVREKGVQTPSPTLMAGGTIKLTLKDYLVNPVPLPDHSWLQGRLSPSQWIDLLNRVNDATLECLVGHIFCQPRHSRTPAQRMLAVKMYGLCQFLSKSRPSWMESGLDLAFYDCDPELKGEPSFLYVKIVPIGSSPVDQYNSANASK